MYINGSEIKNAKKILILANKCDPRKTEINFEESSMKKLYYLEQYKGFFSF